MRRWIWVSLLACVVPAVVAAQVVEPGAAGRRPQRRVAAPAPRPVGVTGEAKLRYIGKQLDLNDEQKQHYEALLEVYRQGQAQATEEQIENLKRLRAIMAERDQAIQAGDTAKAEKLTAQMQSMRYEVRLEEEFFGGLIPILNEKQRETLKELRARLEKDPDISLKPARIVLEASRLGLSAEQSVQLEKIQSEFRQLMRQTPTTPTFAKEDQDRLLKWIIDQVQAILTPDQAAEFTARLAKLRPDEAPPAPAAESETPKPNEEGGGR